MLRVLIITAGTLLVCALSATAAFTQSADEHTIAATVTGQSVSMTVNPGTIDYGTVPFEQSQKSNLLPSPVTFTATNSGNVSEDFTVHGTNAAGTGLSWTLTPDPLGCGVPAANNRFRHSVTPSGGSAIFLSTGSDDFLATGIAAAGTKSFTTEIYMPCFGSTGAGVQASTNIIVTALASP